MTSDERLPYVRPELRTYGAITHLVQGPSGIGLDGLSGMSNMM
ncbi:MAG TPA: hypothetical protein VK948_01260 [Aeromicrobium sp.]|nr:hypothetical protein [Aeromicrobium sp.]